VAHRWGNFAFVSLGYFPWHPGSLRLASWHLRLARTSSKDSELLGYTRDFLSDDCPSAAFAVKPRPVSSEWLCICQLPILHDRLPVVTPAMLQHKDFLLHSMKYGKYKFRLSLSMRVIWNWFWSSPSMSIRGLS
jgi:hypothetical protein